MSIYCYFFVFFLTFKIFCLCYWHFALFSDFFILVCIPRTELNLCFLEMYISDELKRQNLSPRRYGKGCLTNIWQFRSEMANICHIPFFFHPLQILLIDSTLFFLSLFHTLFLAIYCQLIWVGMNVKKMSINICNVEDYLGEKLLKHLFL